MTSENNAAVGAHNGTSSTATGANHHSGVAVAVTEHRVIPGVNAEHDQQRETQQQPPHRVARLVAPTITPTAAHANTGMTVAASTGTVS